MKYIYGPVPSWRLGRSLGIDLISGDKHCTFDCTYCQLGSAPPVQGGRKIFVKTEEIIKEFESLPKELEIDYITFSGRGEPTLASNIGEVAREIKKRTNKPLALLTNSTTLGDPNVRKELELIDLVIAKIDASNEEVLQKINRPLAGITHAKIVEAIKLFKKESPQKLALQVMFTSKNINDASNIAKLAREINPRTVYIGTPTRECAERALSKEEIDKIEKFFKSLLTKSIYSAKKIDVQPISEEDILKRRPRR